MPELLVWSAWLEHAPFAAWLVEQARPRTVVELGTWTGFSYFVLCEAVERTGLEARCWAVYTWEGDDQTGYYGPDVYESVAAHNQPTLRPVFDAAAVVVRRGGGQLC